MRQRGRHPPRAGANRAAAEPEPARPPPGTGRSGRHPPSRHRPAASPARRGRAVRSTGPSSTFSTPTATCPARASTSTSTSPPRLGADRPRSGPRCRRPASRPGRGPGPGRRPPWFPVQRLPGRAMGSHRPAAPSEPVRRAGWAALVLAGATGALGLVTTYVVRLEHDRGGRRSDHPAPGARRLRVRAGLAARGGLIAGAVDGGRRRAHPGLCQSLRPGGHARTLARGGGDPGPPPDHPAAG